MLVQEVIGDDIFAIKERDYLGEVRIRKGEDIAIFPCEMFHQKQRRRGMKQRMTNDIGIGMKSDRNVESGYWRYCFDYVTTNMKGSTHNTTTKFCMPAKLKGNFLAPNS